MLWNSITERGRRVSGCMLEKVYVAVSKLLRVILLRAQKEERGTVDKVLIFLGHTQVILNRILVELWMVKPILIRSQDVIGN